MNAASPETGPTSKPKPTLEEAFRRFHAANPEVFRLFRKFAYQVLNNGLDHYSADAILHRIRWHMDIDVKERDGEFRLNNNHAAYYARLLMQEEPMFEGFFTTRETKSEGATP